MVQTPNKLKKLPIFSGGLSRKLIHACLIGICALLISTLLFRLDSFRSLEIKSRDVLDRLAPAQPTSRNISVVAIDEATINTLSWPITRDYYVSLIHILNEYRAKAIVFDIAFIDKNTNHPVWDSLLALTTGDSLLYSTIIHSFYFNIAENKNQDTSTSFALRRFSQSSSPQMQFRKAISADIPYPFLMENMRHLGHFHLTPDSDGIFRSLPTFIQFNNRLYPNMSLLAAQHFALSGTPAVQPSAVTLKSSLRTITIPVNLSGDFRIWYNGNGEQFETLSLLGLLSAYKQAEKKQERSRELERVIADKIVLIGNTATALGDYGAIPTNNNIPKVYIHASAVSTIINSKFYTTMPPWLALGIITLFLLVLILTCLKFKAVGAFSFWLGITLLYIGITLMLQTNLIVTTLGMPLTALLLCYIGITVYTHFFKEQQVNILETALGKYVTPAILQKITASHKNLVQEKQERELTILFSDIKGFSRMSNTMDPELLHGQLTEYLNAMADIILDNNGTVDKFMGDGIMAYFDSITNDRHTFTAIDASLKMHASVRYLNKKWKEEGRPPISIRIGVNTGKVYIGDLGTGQFSDYTLFGNEVNIAQRLESTAEIDTTYISQAAHEKVVNDFDFKNMGKISLKGIVHPVTCYKVIGHRKMFKGIK